MSTGAQASEAGWISVDLRISGSQVTTRDPILSFDCFHYAAEDEVMDVSAGMEVL
jgi:hypothetical protein